MADSGLTGEKQEPDKKGRVIFRSPGQNIQVELNLFLT